MYVCICNAVTEDDVRSCVAAGAGSAKEVRAAFGMQPGCGTCTKRLCGLVSQARTATQLVNALETADVLEAAATGADLVDTHPVDADLIDADLIDAELANLSASESEEVASAA